MSSDTSAGSGYRPRYIPDDAKLVYCIELDSETPSNNIIKGMHFHAYKSMRRKWRMRVLASLGGNTPSVALDKSFLHIRRYCAGSLDWDNAYGGLKPLLDCLVAPTDRNPDGLGLIADDNPENMPYPPYVEQFKAKQKQGKTELFIYSL